MTHIAEILVPPQAVAWLPWAVQYFFYIGSAYAACLLFALACWQRQRSSHALRCALALVMITGAIVGPLALTADLHQPGRAWHFFVYLTPWSWMSRGAILLPLFSGLSVITGWLYLRADLQSLAQGRGRWLALCSLLALGLWRTPPRLLTALTLLSLLSGLSIALYTGEEIMVLRSRELWNQPPSALLWFFSAFYCAIGLTLLMAKLMRAGSLFNRFDRRFLTLAGTASFLTSLITLIIWASGAQQRPILPDPFWQTRLAILCLLFTAALACLIWQQRTYWLATWLLIAAGAWLRWVGMIDVQLIPRYDAGLYPYTLPLFSNGGVISIIGIAGLWLALASIFSSWTHAANPHTVTAFAGAHHG